MDQPHVKIAQERLAEFCRRYHITKLSLFGSVLRKDFRPDSDVDVLVEFAAGQEPGFIKLYEIEQGLANLLGRRRPDLVTPKFLNRRIRQDVLAAAQVQYAER